ncbi:MAG: SH3 domain-containing protein [Lachnospiraceae bacterium]|nr:SH3 domain-containing protein [Lachnospiraceae bacterium]
MNTARLTAIILAVLLLSSTLLSFPSVLRADPGGMTMICVPTDEMSLRAEPGLGDDILATLYCGDRVTWDGEQTDVNEVTYYHVLTADGITGWIRAEFCVPVYFEYDDSLLGLVDPDEELYTYEMMKADLETLCGTYPDILSSAVIGQSLCGRDIYEVTLGNPEVPHHVMLQSTIHAREYMNTQLVMRLIEYYAAYYDTGSWFGTSYRDLFANTALHIVPMANPDGVALCQEGIGAVSEEYQALIRECYERDKMTLEFGEDSMHDYTWIEHYKDEEYIRDGNAAFPSFEEYLQLWKANAAGVDLNRNFDAGWEALDQKKEPAYTDFKGSAPVSEPETQCLVAMAESRTYDCFLSYHSKGGLIYYDVEGNTASNSAASAALAGTMQYATGYKPKETMKGIDVVLGGFGDWVQLALDRPYVTLECGRHPCPLAQYEFESIWIRYRESWAALAASLNR